MDKKKRVYASNAAFYLLAVVGIAVVLNLISTRVFGRLDLTEAKVYTLSPASKDVVKALPDYFTVKAYISENLPPEMKLISRYVRDLLDEYRGAGGKFKFEAIDPGEDKKLVEEASSCGVRKLQVQKLENQKFEVGAYFLGMCLQYSGKTEAIPEIMGTEGLEYQLSSLIKRMTQRKRKLVLTTGHGELDFQNGLRAMQQVVAQEFETATTNPSSGPIPDDADALLVAGPKQAFDDAGRKEIDKFLMKGKGAIFLVDGMTMQAPRGQMEMPGMPSMPKMGQANDTGLSDLLKGYGFNVGQDFVLDRQNAPGPLDVGGGRRMLANVPVYVGVEMERAKGKEKDMGVLAGLTAVIFPYPSSVELVGPLAGGKPAQGKLWKLASSSGQSWKATGMFFLPQNEPLTEPKDNKDKGPYALAYAYEGTLKSAFAAAAPPPAAGMSTPEPAAPNSQSAKPVRLLVVGDSDFTNDEYVMLSRSPILQIYGNGAQLLLNAIGWTMEDEALAPVRAKTVTSRPIRTESDSTVLVVKAINIIGVPLAFCLFGIARWRLRHNRRQAQKL
jgi:gliding-associated putative ABC transporter substrate-binding component GldG